MKYKFNGTELLEDLVQTTTAGIHTVGFTLSYLGLTYINEHLLGKPIQTPPPENIPVLSVEFGFYATQMICIGGAGFEAIRFAYNTIKTPLKLVTGKYFTRNNPQSPQQASNR